MTVHLPLGSSTNGQGTVVSYPTELSLFEMYVMHGPSGNVTWPQYMCVKRLTCFCHKLLTVQVAYTYLHSQTINPLPINTLSLISFLPSFLPSFLLPFSCTSAPRRVSAPYIPLLSSPTSSNRRRCLLFDLLHLLIALGCSSSC